MPKGVTTNVLLQRLANRMRVLYFRSIFIRTALPTGVRRNKSDIVKLDNAEGLSTYWVACAKRENRAIYFDSFGNLRPPKKLPRYLKNNVT